jgi:hypothetical protein
VAEIFKAGCGQSCFVAKGRMAAGLDHVVHAVRDLDAAAECYRRIGFTVGARNRHPWGTHNHIVQLPEFFVELLMLAEPDKLDNGGFSELFGAYSRDFVQRGEGLSLLILQSDDARVDEAAFRAANIASFELMRFEREGQRPDGSVVKVGFSLAFADDKMAPDIHFAVCQQHYPEKFWNPAYQDHANGAQTINGVALVADDPAEHRDFLQSFSGGRAEACNGALVLETARGIIDVLTPAAFTSRFAAPAPSMVRGARLAALRFGVRDIAAAGVVLQKAGITNQLSGDRVVIGPQAALGATIVFEQLNNAR